MIGNKFHILTETGQAVEAQAPLVVSASRSTDIPAFYSKWFVNRLRKGYVVWYNPFNNKPIYVSFKKTRVIVFWSKNPRPMIQYLKELDWLGFQYYFQFTLNDYEHERLEPKVPSLTERIETFCHLSELIGHERVIWRFDPLIITPQTSVRDLLAKLWRTGNQIKGFTDKLVFSFIDVNAYRKVKKNLLHETSFYTKHTIADAEFSKIQIDEFVQGLVKIQERWHSEGWNITLATCAEDIDLSKYKIEHNSCVDGMLMRKIFSTDVELLHYLKYGNSRMHHSLLHFYTGNEQVHLKDKGQRKSCECIVSKDIGMYNTCPHICVYCYANISPKNVQENIDRHSDEAESIITCTSQVFT
jgi:DNA repair photolyase